MVNLKNKSLALLAMCLFSTAFADSTAIAPPTLNQAGAFPYVLARGTISAPLGSSSGITFPVSKTCLPNTSAQLSLGVNTATGWGGNYIESINVQGTLTSLGNIGYQVFISDWVVSPQPGANAGFDWAIYCVPNN